jgi:hypothetical protein
MRNTEFGIGNRGIDSFLAAVLFASHYSLTTSN